MRRYRSFIRNMLGFNPFANGKVPPLEERLTEKQRELKILMQEGCSAEASCFLAKSPETTVFFLKTLFHDEMESKCPEFFWEAQVSLSKAAAEPGPKADKTVQILAQALEHEDMAVRSFAAQTLSSAVKDEDADILFAVKALERSIHVPDLADHAASSLAMHYVKNFQKDKLMGLLESDNFTVRTWASKIVSITAAEGNRFSVLVLLGGCSRDDADIRKECARSLAAAFYQADEDVRGEIRAEFRKYHKRQQKSNLVYLDVVIEMQQVENVLGASKK
ncbi:hypothetical protein GF318_02000 [Candidatus Micrarchaeota archaeon]|nr:hypothetical protein [Candidatus Micrarchaeota archaeon]